MAVNIPTVADFLESTTQQTFDISVDTEAELLSMDRSPYAGKTVVALDSKKFYTIQEEDLGLFFLNMYLQPLPALVADVLSTDLSTQQLILPDGNIKHVDTLSGLAVTIDFPPSLSVNTSVVVPNQSGTLALFSDTLYSPTRTLTTSGSAALSDYTLRADCTSASVTVALPNASTCSGKVYRIKKVDATNKAVFIDASPSSIDGVALARITTSYASLTIQSNGTTWDIL